MQTRIKVNNAAQRTQGGGAQYAPRQHTKPAAAPIRPVERRCAGVNTTRPTGTRGVGRTPREQALLHAAVKKIQAEW